MYLARSSPRNLVGYIQYSNQTLYALWENLEDALIEGTNRWEQVFGTGVTVTSYMSDPARKRDFLCGMHGFGLLSSPAVVSAFDLSRFRCFVDLGGATGHLVSAALAQYPSMRGILFELPSTIELVRDLISDEIEIITGDYFRDPLPAGDLFALGRILHSQSRDKSLTLLRRVWDSLPPEGAVLVVETLLDGGKSISAHLQSLNMLLVNGGCERALSEYEELFQEAGFKNICAAITGTPLDAVIALK